MFDLLGDGGMSSPPQQVEIISLVGNIIRGTANFLWIFEGHHTAMDKQTAKRKKNPRIKKTNILFS